jgi:hypothetical protein
MAKVSEHRNLIAIPSETVLSERLTKVLSEAKRLKLLIRTARELDRIHSEKDSREDQPRE